MVPDDLIDALDRLASRPAILVACDFDGVLAPLVSDPSKSAPLPDSADALRALAEAPDTTVAVVSGRDRETLAALSGFGPPMHLVGSHGAQFAGEFIIGPSEAALLDRLAAELARLSAGVDGVLLERKPASIAVHVRNTPAEAGERVLAAVSDGPAQWPGVHPTAGKMVLELAVIEASKGAALDVLRQQVDADAVLYVGDDVTDEKAFARLGSTDVGIKVGPGETLATYRVADPVAVTQVLRQLVARRA